MHARPRFRMLLPAVLVALLLAPALSGCGTQGTGSKGYVVGDGVITKLPAGQRTRIGTVSGTTLDGKHVDLADDRGKVVVVNVWGSWCPPCRAEAPTLASAEKRLRGDGVVFVGINTRDPSKANGLAFERRYGVAYPSIYDPDGKNLLAFRGTISPSSIPSTLIVDRQGRVAASILGQVPSSTTLVDLVHDVKSSA